MDEHTLGNEGHGPTGQLQPQPLRTVEPHPRSSRVTTVLTVPASRPAPPRPLCRHFLWVCNAEEKMAALGEPVRLERGECGGARGRGGSSGSGPTDRFARGPERRGGGRDASTRSPSSAFALLAGGAAGPRGSR